MNHIVAIALGGACGAVIRFLMSSGLYQWLGREFPYGTLAVNIVGSFMMGLLSETLILEGVALSTEYRAAILVGFIGAFTTFSTFSLDTLTLLSQGELIKAALNVVISVFACLIAVWIGLLFGKTLFTYSSGVIHWSNGTMLPYAVMIANALCAFILGLIATLILNKVSLSGDLQSIIVIIMLGLYLTFSGLYVILFLLEHNYSFTQHLHVMILAFTSNTVLCLLVSYLGLMIGRQW